jgi:hypothetical protein
MGRPRVQGSSGWLCACDIDFPRAERVVFAVNYFVRYKLLLCIRFSRQNQVPLCKEWVIDLERRGLNALIFFFFLTRTPQVKASLLLSLTISFLLTDGIIRTPCNKGVFRKKS